MADDRRLLIILGWSIAREAASSGPSASADILVSHYDNHDDDDEINVYIKFTWTKTVVFI